MAVFNKFSVLVMVKLEMPMAFTRSLLTSPVDYNNIKADHLEAIVLQSYHEANDKSFCKCCYLEFQGDLYHSH